MDRSIALGLALVVALAATPALAAVEDEPRFEAYTPEPRLEPGETQTVTIELVNDAEDPEDRVPPATAVRVEPRAGNTPFEIRSGTRSIGRMEDGEIREVDVRLTVPDDAPGGRYRLPLRPTSTTATSAKATPSDRSSRCPAAPSSRSTALRRNSVSASRGRSHSPSRTSARVWPIGLPSR